MVEGERKAVLSVERGLHMLTYRWSADPAFLAGLAPIAAVTGASEGVLLVSAPGDAFGVLAEPGAGLVVVAQEAGTIELTLRARRPGAPLSAEIELKRVEAPRPAYAMPAARAREPLPLGGAEFLVSAHVSLRGDLTAGRGDWVCGPQMPGRIEGLELRGTTEDLPLEYQVATGGRTGGWTSWFPAGTYAGSRGKAVPLIGLRIRLKPEAAASLALKAEAAFLGATTVTRVGREIELTGPSLLDPLVGLKLDFVTAEAAEAAPREPVATPASSRLRVFRRLERANEAA